MNITSFISHKSTLIFSVAIVALLFTFTACNQEEPQEVAQEEIELTELDASVESTYESVDDVTFEALEETDQSVFARSFQSSSNKSLNSPCVTITNDSINKIVTVDFGTGCLCNDGKFRSGQIVIDYTKRLYRPGATLSVSLVNYFVDSVQVEGTKTYTNLAQSFQDTMQLQVELVGGKVTLPSGDIATRDFDRTRTWVRALHPINDEFWVDGTASGTRFNGNSFTVTITETLVFKRKCRVQGIHVPVEGEKEINRSGKPDVFVDYGDGTCDTFADITVNGNTTTVDLQ